MSLLGLDGVTLCTLSTYQLVAAQLDHYAPILLTFVTKKRHHQCLLMSAHNGLIIKGCPIAWSWTIHQVFFAKYVRKLRSQHVKCFRITGAQWEGRAGASSRTCQTNSPPHP